MPPFSLLGGPLHGLGLRLGLVRHGTNTVRLGLAIGVPLWGVLMLLALVDGIDVLTFEGFSAHARLLLAIPLLFVCESVLDPRLTEFVRTVARSGVVPRAALPDLQALVERLTRLKDAWLPELLCLFAAMGLGWLGTTLQIPGFAGRDVAAADLTLTGLWYWAVCLTVLRFLLLRWIWRLCLWCYFLWRLSRLPLRLLPSHPDGVAGLGKLELAHGHFGPLVLAFSVILAASFAADIHAGTLQLADLYSLISLLLLVNAVLFVGPLFLFTPRLWACRVKGLNDYMELSERYVQDFEAKWLRADTPPDKPLLGSADIQSLADLGSSVERVYRMRLVPVSVRLLIQLAIPALLPMLPLVLFKVPLSELAEQFFTRLTRL